MGRGAVRGNPDAGGLPADAGDRTDETGQWPAPPSNTSGIRSRACRCWSTSGLSCRRDRARPFNRRPDRFPFFGITDQRTGLTYGGGLTVEVLVVNRASITGTFNIWREVLYGGWLYNFDQVLGLAWRFRLVRRPA